MFIAICFSGETFRLSYSSIFMLLDLSECTFMNLLGTPGQIMPTPRCQYLISGPILHHHHRNPIHLHTTCICDPYHSPLVFSNANKFWCL